MKNINTLIKTIVAILVFSTAKISAQCNNTSSYGSGTAPTQGSSITITTCQFGGEYNTISSVVSGNTYSTASSVSTDYFTVRSGSSSGPVVAAGNSPLVWTATTAGTHYIHCNTNSLCATQSSCRSIFLGCYGPACNNSSSYGSATAPALNASVTISTCQFGGEYATLSGVTAGNVYVNFSSVNTDYITIRSGSVSGPVVASGLTPLTWTAQVSGTHYVHNNTNSSCGSASACRTTSLTCIGSSAPPPTAPANDLCSNALLMSVPSNTSGTTINATAESPAPPTCVTSIGTAGVWYKVVGNGNQYGADLCTASAWDSKIMVFTGSCGSWNCITGNDDYGPLCSSAAASATWCSVPSTTYYILAMGYSSASAFTINVTQTVNVVTPTVVVTAGTPSTCLGSSTSLNASGASTYSWSTASTGASISVIPSATTVYSVTGNASVGCGYDVKTVTVTSIPLPTIIVSGNTGSVCPGGTFAIVPSGGTNYTYTSLGSTLTGVSTTVSPIANTIYTVSGLGSNGCVSNLAGSATVNIATLSSPTLVLTASPASVCPSINSTLSVSGANTYTWVSPSSNLSSVTVNALATTVYTVSGTGTNVCNGVKTITLTVYPTPTITINSGTLCTGYTFNLVPGGASTYTIVNASGTVATAVTPSANANYTVTGTSAVGCLSTASVAPISTVFVVPSPTMSAVSGSMCIGSSFSLSPNGANGTTFVNGTNIGTNTAGAYSPIVNTTYSVSGTNSNGCASFSPAVVNITVVPVPTLSAISSATYICVGQASANLTASGAATYTWNTLATTSSISVSPSVASVYTVVGTSTLLCSNFATVALNVAALPQFGAQTNNNFVCVAGSSTLTATDPALTYSWSTGGTLISTVVNPTVTSTYTATGVDALGCKNNATISINVNTLNINVAPTSGTVCLGNGITYTASGGLSSNSYTWTGGSNFPTYNVTPTVNSVYTVSAKDANNCPQTKTVSATVNQLPVVSISITRTLICLKESSTLTANGASSFMWNNASTTSVIVVSPTANLVYNYSVVGTDANNCSASATQSLTVSECLGIDNSVSKANLFNVYPNPSNGNYNIEFADNALKVIQVIDLTGRVILSEQSTAVKLQINLSNYANGVYYLKVNSNNQQNIIRLIKD